VRTLSVRPSNQLIAFFTNRPLCAIARPIPTPIRSKRTYTEHKALAIMTPHFFLRCDILLLVCAGGTNMQPSCTPPPLIIYIFERAGDVLLLSITGDNDT